MYYTREKHKRFLDKELTAISEDYLKKLNTKATALLADNKVYVTQFVKLDMKESPAADSSINVLGAGQLMLRFRKDKGIPRKNEYFTAVLLDKQMCLPKNWGDLSWGKLRAHQLEYSEVHCVWHGKTDDKGFLLCGFSGVSIEMSRYLMENKLEGCVVVLGPQAPPIEYYQNLIGIVSNEKPDVPAATILDFEKASFPWNPQMVNSNAEQIPGIIKALDTNNQLIFQGPPGTGKTHLIAGLVAELLSQNKSVLVTALTNRALIELAEKESLKGHLEAGNVMKTNVSTDEQTKCKNLCPISSKEISCVSGKATLSTFYNASGWACDCYEEQPFDYVIMDEASQALLGMIAACKNLGKKVLWIGDQKQMQPIIMLSDETIARNDYYMLANGFQTLCDNFKYPSYILTETRRLLPRAAALTSTFYHVPIKSVAEFEYLFKDANKDYFPKDGGCSIVYQTMPAGKKDDYKSCQHVAGIVDDVLQKDKNLEVAVLAKFTDSVKMLQNCVIDRLGTRQNVLVDTVERVQGLTCDVCIFYIPNTMMAMSLDRPLFNVATSRAKQMTIIVCDPTIKNENCDNDVRRFLALVANGATEIVPASAPTTTSEETSPAAAAGFKVLGKIDLSLFETPKQKAVKSQVKRNIYIIDTNVFVNCPDILSKIDASYQVVLSAKVIDELDKLKITLDADGKRNVEKALRNINRAMDNPNVTMELSDPSLLPDDFNKRSPDNIILTVALKFKSENPILLTSDNGLQIKAKGLKIATISLKDFLAH